ncbi:MAG: DUF4296 domain-containing protein [Flavobacteriaceae bacterium]
MKKYLFVLIIFLGLVACNNQPVEKPKNLIPEKKMTEILYDMALLDAIRTQAPYSPGKPKVDARKFIYQKYQVDSAQLVLSNRYYISQVEIYKKMYDQVNERLTQEKQKAEKATGKEEPLPLTDLPKVE